MRRYYNLALLLILSVHSASKIGFKNQTSPHVGFFYLLRRYATYQTHFTQAWLVILPSHCHNKRQFISYLYLYLFVYLPILSQLFLKIEYSMRPKTFPPSPQTNSIHPLKPIYLTPTSLILQSCLNLLSCLSLQFLTTLSPSLTSHSPCSSKVIT